MLSGILKNPAQLIAAIKGRKALVIGDAILDVYEKGTTDKLCREAPAPVVNLSERVFSCGGAANTAVNMAALGGSVSLLTVLGDDAEADRMTEALTKHNVDCSMLIRSAPRRTLSKTRICVGANILVRVDAGDTMPIDGDSREILLSTLESRLPEFDVIVLSDYGYGLLSDDVLRDLPARFRDRTAALVVDAKQPQRFRHLAPTAVKPNYKEAISALELSPAADSVRVEQIIACGNDLLDITGADFVAATLDMNGTVLLERDTAPCLVSCIPREDRQTVGAGDSFVSALALSLAAGFAPRDGIRLAAAAAAIVIDKEGTGVCSGDELRDYFCGHNKRVDRIDELADVIAEMKRQHRRIVFTNGCFDLLHRGHVDFLRQARALGDVLVVALNSDASIRRIKGESRPVNSLEDRMEVLAGLESVDVLTSFDSDSPVDLLRALRPDVFAKGGTYSVGSLPEAALVEAQGGEVEIVPFYSHLTTTRLIERIQHPAGSATAENGRRAI